MAISLEKKTGTSNTQVSCISILTKGFGVGLVYQTFLDGYLFHFTDEAKNASTNLIEAALGLHTLVSNTFRKTATNFQYEFNIRHISNAFRGLLVSWLHESVYGDRLVSVEDRQSSTRWLGH